MADQKSPYIPDYKNYSLVDLKIIRDFLREHYDRALKEVIAPEKAEARFVNELIDANREKIKKIKNKKFPFKALLSIDYYSYPDKPGEFYISVLPREIKNKKDLEIFIKEATEKEKEFLGRLSIFNKNTINFQTLRLKLRYAENELSKKVFGNEEQIPKPSEINQIKSALIEMSINNLDDLIKETNIKKIARDITASVFNTRNEKKIESVRQRLIDIRKGKILF